MAQLIALLTLINQLFPLILKTIETVEQAFPAGGQGAAKLAMVQETIKKAMEVSGEVAVTSTQLYTVLGPVINGIVALKNSTGMFKKSTI